MSETILTPEESERLLAKKLFAIYSGCSNNDRRATDEWNILSEWQREQWLVAAKYIETNYYKNPNIDYSGISMII